MIPLFDSLSHPTLSGRWLDDATPSDFEGLAAALEPAGFAAACAVGIAGVAGYEHETFAERCAGWPRLVPIAGVHPRPAEALAVELESLAALGFRGVKIHPRFSKMPADPGLLGEVLAAIADQGLVTFYCTYMHQPLATYPTTDPFHLLVEALQRAPAAKLVLVHGGDVQLLRYAELVRFNPNLLLDLSMTLFKYRGSSIDADVRFLCSQFDRRICVGTDHPERSHAQLRERFDEITAGIPEEKARNIGYLNLSQFLGVEVPLR